MERGRRREEERETEREKGKERIEETLKNDRRKKKVRSKEVKECQKTKDATVCIISFHILSNGRLKFYHVLRDADDRGNDKRLRGVRRVVDHVPIDPVRVNPFQKDFFSFLSTVEYLTIDFISLIRITVSFFIFSNLNINDDRLKKFFFEFKYRFLGTWCRLILQQRIRNFFRNFRFAKSRIKQVFQLSVMRTCWIPNERTSNLWEFVRTWMSSPGYRQSQA